MRASTLLALTLAAAASATKYHPSASIPQISVQLADAYDVQVLGDGGVNKEGCFNIDDADDPMKQAGVVHAAVNSEEITAFFYTSPDCVRNTRIFKQTAQKISFKENPVLARSVRIINPALMKAAQAEEGAGSKVRGVNAWNAWLSIGRPRRPYGRD
ncbi:hypothetical protein HDU86_006588 [Geranomyces michiganensis]|nr:hypothetical protein HDU86_006588 [Geranomyces michiganensis]